MPVETDGNLPTGQPLAAAIQKVDRATAGYPSYYMLNCAHHDLYQVLKQGTQFFIRYDKHGWCGCMLAWRVGVVSRHTFARRCGFVEGASGLTVQIRRL